MLNLRVMSAVSAAVLLAACGGGSETETPIPSEDVAVEAPAPFEQAKNPIVEAPKPKKAKASLWDEAMPLDDQLLIDIFHWLNPDLTATKEHGLYQACFDDSDKINAAARNEFAWQGVVDEATADLKRRIEALPKQYPLKAGEPLRFRAAVKSKLGDYDFETESFPFTPIDFDVLREDLAFGTVCKSPSGQWDTMKPSTWPEDYQLKLTNPSAVTSLPMARKDAQALIEGMANDSHMDSRMRFVAFEFVIEVVPESLSLQPQLRDVGPTYAGTAKIIYARVKARHTEKIVAEYPLGFLE